MGLRRGFCPGRRAKNLLMTLWPVFDVPSGELMVELLFKTGIRTITLLKHG